MAKTSAGILLYRTTRGGLEVFLVHPGGPFWKSRDRHAWSIPKGLCGEGEDPLAAALREFGEETGCACAGPFRELGEVRQGGGKRVLAWAAEGECDAGAVRSNTFPLEWPPGSGRRQEFPEVDRAGWFPAAEAVEKLVPGQVALLERLSALLGPGPPAAGRTG